MNFTFNRIDLCATSDKRAHYFVSEAERNGMKVVEINNHNYVLIVTELVYRAEDAVFQKIESATYVFRE